MPNTESLTTGSLREINAAESATELTIEMLSERAVEVAVEGTMTRRTLVPFMQRVCESDTNSAGTKSAHLVRGSSRRMIFMRFRPSNIRVINRRDDRLDRHLCCSPSPDNQHANGPPPKFLLTPLSISEDQFQRELERPWPTFLKECV